MKKYIVNRSNFNLDNKPVPEGEIVELTDTQAATLLVLQAIVEDFSGEGFTPTEPNEGIAEVEQADTAGTGDEATAAPIPRKTKGK